MDRICVKFKLVSIVLYPLFIYFLFLLLSFTIIFFFVLYFSESFFNLFYIIYPFDILFHLSINSSF
jgi:hypothetical protein